jgi:hypothetical protein
MGRFPLSAEEQVVAVARVIEPCEPILTVLMTILLLLLGGTSNGTQESVTAFDGGSLLLFARPMQTE